MSRTNKVTRIACVSCCVINNTAVSETSDTVYAAPADRHQCSILHCTISKSANLFWLQPRPCLAFSIINHSMVNLEVTRLRPSHKDAPGTAASAVFRLPSCDSLWATNFTEIAATQQQQQEQLQCCKRQMMQVKEHILAQLKSGLAAR